MKAEITIDHLKYYLGTDLQIIDEFDEVRTLSWQNQSYNTKEVGLNHVLNLASTSGFKVFKPCLRPMSDLTKPIEHNGERFVPIEEVQNYHNFSIVHTGDLEKDPLRYPFSIVKKLFEWHFNVFDLDPSLWVDKNTI